MNLPSPSNMRNDMHRIERREWVPWSFAILVTLLLTAGPHFVSLSPCCMST